MHFKLKKHNTYIILGGIICFLIGYFLFRSHNSTKLWVFQLVRKDNLKIGQDFFTIFKVNMLVGLGILIGFITYNSFTFFLYTFNMITIGYYIHYYMIKFGLLRCLYLILPHGLLEITWLTLLTIHSFSIFESFKIAINSGFEKNDFVRLLFSKKTLYLLTLILVTALIEAFLTTTLNKIV